MADEPAATARRNTPRDHCRRRIARRACHRRPDRSEASPKPRRRRRHRKMAAHTAPKTRKHRRTSAPNARGGARAIPPQEKIDLPAGAFRPVRGLTRPASVANAAATPPKFCGTASTRPKRTTREPICPARQRRRRRRRRLCDDYPVAPSGADPGTSDRRPPAGRPSGPTGRPPGTELRCPRPSVAPPQARTPAGRRLDARSSARPRWSPVETHAPRSRTPPRCRRWRSNSG